MQSPSLAVEMIFDATHTGLNCRVSLRDSLGIACSRESLDDFARSSATSSPDSNDEPAGGTAARCWGASHGSSCRAGPGAHLPALGIA